MNKFKPEVRESRLKRIKSKLKKLRKRLIDYAGSDGEYMFDQLFGREWE